LGAWISLFHDLPRLLSQRKRIQAKLKQLKPRDVYRFFR
jgi:hypothetical protein